MTTKATTEHILPLDVMFRIFLEIAMQADPSDIDYMFRDRGALRLIHSYIRDYIDDTPAFWTTWLLTPRINIAHLPTTMSRAHHLPFQLTIRISDSHEAATKYSITALLDLAQPFMNTCTDILIEAREPDDASYIVARLRVASVVSLRSLSLSFHDPSPARPHPPDFAFLAQPVLGPAFAPATILSLTSSSVRYAIVAYAYSSKDNITLSITQPLHHSIHWSQFTSILSLQSTLTALILVGPGLEDEAVFVPSPTLPTLTCIHLDFRGSHSMVRVVSRLVVPNLKTLRIVLASREDVECAFRCPYIIANVQHVILVGTCPTIPSLPDFFRLLHKVEYLDIRHATVEFYDAISTASRIPPREGHTNWNACPSLKHLSVRHVSIAMVQSLLFVRAASGYNQLSSIHFERHRFEWNSSIISWYQARNIALSFGM